MELYVFVLLLAIFPYHVIAYRCLELLVEFIPPQGSGLVLELSLREMVEGNLGEEGLPVAVVLIELADIVEV